MLHVTAFGSHADIILDDRDKRSALGPHALPLACWKRPVTRGALQGARYKGRVTRGALQGARYKGRVTRGALQGARYKGRVTRGALQGARYKGRITRGALQGASYKGRVTRGALQGARYKGRVTRGALQGARYKGRVTRGALQGARCKGRVTRGALQGARGGMGNCLGAAVTPPVPLPLPPDPLPVPTSPSELHCVSPIVLTRPTARVQPSRAAGGKINSSQVVGGAALPASPPSSAYPLPSPPPLPPLPASPGALREFSAAELQAATNGFSRVVGEGGSAELHAATGGFSRVVGEGGFGRVYHGRLTHPAGRGGRDMEVAVKVMAAEHITGGMSSFQVEVAAMTAMQHPRILRLLGYVGDSPSPVLVYEYIPGGDCCEFLKRSGRGEASFPWRARLGVALGCAEALAAIHDANFVHRDFKASNVLLREDLTPVLADFGLARAVTDWATHVSTRVMGSMGYMDPIYFQTVMGSMGYMDPIYFQTGQLSRKSDTYAFGIFLLELVSGCLALDDRFQDLRKLVVAKTFPDPHLVVDPRMSGQWTKKQVYIVFTLIRFAIFFDWDNRPSMSVMRDKLLTVVE
ncbi:unnamed protein product [Closterium sp. Yama58-4]|nr:unnamed protein product [Closterium sp. Yama58-4]